MVEIVFDRLTSAYWANVLRAYALISVVHYRLLKCLILILLFLRMIVYGAPNGGIPCSPRPWKIKEISRCNLWPAMSKFLREISQATRPSVRQRHQEIDALPSSTAVRPALLIYRQLCARVVVGDKKLLPILVDPSVNQCTALSLTSVKHSCGCLTNCVHAAHLFHSLWNEFSVAARSGTGRLLTFSWAIPTNTWEK